MVLTACLLLTVVQGLIAQFIQNNPVPCPNITGRLTYFNNAATPLYDAQVQLKTTAGQVLQTIATDYLGQYSFCQLTPGDYIISAVSSLPAGGINAADALIALRHYVGDITLTGLKFKAADINDNGYVNSTDALMILRRYVEQITTFPAGDWVFESNAVNITNASVLVVDFKALCYGDLDGSVTPAGCFPMPTPADAGPDQTVTGTSTTLAANTPVDGTGSWSIVAGTGGSIAEPGNPLSAFSGVAGNTYTLAWTITTICTAFSDTVTIILNTPSFNCGLPFTDTRDGQVYNTVQIGTQCWMRENLNIGTMVVSVNYGGFHSDCSNNGIIEKYCYNNDPAYCAIYGGLYDWDEMMGYTTTPGVQGICPDGWHIPSDAEWCTLTSFLDPTINCATLGYSGTNAGGKMKKAGFDHWLSPNIGATNESGFTALGTGSRYPEGQFYDLSQRTNVWSSSEQSAITGFHVYLGYTAARAGRTYNNKVNGLSVRCVRNN